MAVLTRLDHLFGRLLRAFVIAAIALILILITLGVVARTVPVFSMSGYDEIIEWLVAWMTFAGTVALWREGTLFNIDIVSMASSDRAVKVLNVVARLLMLLFALVFTWKGCEFTAGTMETMPFLFVSKISWYAAMPVCGAFMILYGLIGLWRAVAEQPARPQAPSVPH
jgi:TRAP-type C4-dicarboxylate transport system permease small subunit